MCTWRPIDLLKIVPLATPLLYFLDLLVMLLSRLPLIVRKYRRYPRLPERHRRPIVHHRILVRKQLGTMGQSLATLRIRVCGERGVRVVLEKGRVQCVRFCTAGRAAR